MPSQYFRLPAGKLQPPRRAAFLEKLLARADTVNPAGDWRAEAFRVVAPRAATVPAVAAIALAADHAAVAGEWVCLATPVHYVADMTTVHLPQNGILSVQRAGAESLAADFNHVWKDAGCRLVAGASANLYCIFDRTLEVTTHDPEEVLERGIEPYLPMGADAARLRRLMSEMEMWLFQNGANSVRERMGLPRVSGLWLWGGGAPRVSLPVIDGWIAGDDVFFSALSTSNVRKSDAAVIVAAQAPGEDGWSDFESRWLKPAAAMLRSGRISRLNISSGDRCVMVSARAMRRFWRSSVPWWESLA